MSGLTAQDVLHIWETGLAQHPVDRALTMLAQGYPEISREQLARYSIGQRDALLLALREKTFDSRLDALEECAACRTPLEFTLDAAHLRLTRAHAPVETVFELHTADNYAVEYRLLNSFDLAAIALCAEEDEARALLIERCIVRASAGGKEVLPKSLPESVTVELSTQLAAHDAQAEIEIELLCPACGHRWQTLFDIASFMWTEICAQAQRLLREVDLLARSYGWSESDILGLSHARRQSYLAMVT